MVEDIASKLKALGKAAEAIKKIEDETKDLNFDWSLLFPEKKKIHLGWLISSIAVFVAICASAIFVGTANQQNYILLFAGGLLATTWVACCAHLRFDNKTITGSVFFSLIVTLLVAGRVLTPSEGAQKMLDQVSKDVQVKEPSSPASKEKTP